MWRSLNGLRLRANSAARSPIRAANSPTRERDVLFPSTTRHAVLSRRSLSEDGNLGVGGACWRLLPRRRELFDFVPAVGKAKATSKIAVATRSECRQIF
jgi:hypothetical protein